MKSLRYWSYLATIIAFICTIVAYLGQDYLNTILPNEYTWLAPVIVGIAMTGNQFVENKRVVRAEDIVKNDINSTIMENAELNPEYTTSEYTINNTDDDSGEGA